MHRGAKLLDWILRGGRRRRYEDRHGEKPRPKIYVHPHLIGRDITLFQVASRERTGRTRGGLETRITGGGRRSRHAATMCAHRNRSDHKGRSFADTAGLPDHSRLLSGRPDELHDLRARNTV